MAWFFTKIIFQPLLSATVFLYNTVGLHNLGFTIICMTVGVRFLIAPFSLGAARSQRALATLAPELDKIKAAHPKDQAAQSQAVMQLYRERGINPLAGCLPLIIQLPILIGLYRVFLSIFKPGALDLVYHVISKPDHINLFFGPIDISQPGHWVAVIAGVLQFFQIRIAMSGQQQSKQVKAMNSQMMILLPAMITVIGWTLPAGLAFYWVTTTLFSIGEQLYLRRTSGILAP
jgi:YidC/Oxa1 family membrane protein insertase